MTLEVLPTLWFYVMLTVVRLICFNKKKTNAGTITTQMLIIPCSTLVALSKYGMTIFLSRFTPFRNKQNILKNPN